MKCSEIVKLINKQADGQLVEEEQIVLKKHMDKCHLCREKVRNLEKIELFLKNTEMIPPDNFTDKVMSKLPEGETVLDPLKESFIFFPRWKWLSVGAIIILLGFSSILFVKRRSLERLINFTLEMPEARTVSLVGDFNGWDVNVYKLIRQNGSWKIKLNLPRGRYQYVFVVDGNKWVPDPEAKEYIDNGYGGKNSVLDITRL